MQEIRLEADSQCHTARAERALGSRYRLGAQRGSFDGGAGRDRRDGRAPRCAGVDTRAPVRYQCGYCHRENASAARTQTGRCRQRRFADRAAPRAAAEEPPAPRRVPASAEGKANFADTSAPPGTPSSPPPLASGSREAPTRARHGCAHPLPPPLPPPPPLRAPPPAPRHAGAAPLPPGPRGRAGAAPSGRGPGAGPRRAHARGWRPPL